MIIDGGIIMNQRAKTPAFVLGLIGGIINVINTLLLLIVMIPTLSYISAYLSSPDTIVTIPALSQIFGYISSPDIIGPILILVLLFLASVVNLIGACVCRNKRITGGLMMVITGGVLLIYLIIAFTNPYSIASIGAESSAIVILSIWVIGLLLSITGGIMCLTGSGAPVQYPVYGQPYGQPPYQPPQQPDNTNNQ